MLFYGPGALFELTIGARLVVKGVDQERWQAVSDPQTDNARQS